MPDSLWCEASKPPYFFLILVRSAFFLRGLIWNIVWFTDIRHSKSFFGRNPTQKCGSAPIVGQVDALFRFKAISAWIPGPQESWEKKYPSCIPACARRGPKKFYKTLHFLLIFFSPLADILVERDHWRASRRKSWFPHLWTEVRRQYAGYERSRCRADITRIFYFGIIELNKWWVPGLEPGIFSWHLTNLDLY